LRVPPPPAKPAAMSDDFWRAVIDPGATFLTAGPWVRWARSCCSACRSGRDSRGCADGARCRGLSARHGGPLLPLRHRARVHLRAHPARLHLARPLDPAARTGGDVDPLPRPARGGEQAGARSLPDSSWWRSASTR
jgi:hypothetical protein